MEQLFKEKTQTFITNIVERYFFRNNLKSIPLINTPMEQMLKLKYNIFEKQSELLNIIDKENYENLMKLFEIFFGLDINSKILYYEIMDSIMFEPIYQQIRYHEKNEIMTKIPTFLIFFIIDYIIKSELKTHNNEINLFCVINKKNISRIFLEEILYFINKSFNNNKIIDYLTLLKYMSDDKEYYKRLFHYIFYLGNLGITENLNLGYTYLSFMNGIIEFMYICYNSFSNNKLDYSFSNNKLDNYIYFFDNSINKILYTILNNYYYNNIKLINYFTDVFINYDEFLKYLQKKDIDKNLKKIFQGDTNLFLNIYFSNICNLYLIDSHIKIKTLLKMEFINDYQRNGNLLKTSSFSNFLMLFYKISNVHLDNKKISKGYKVLIENMNLSKENRYYFIGIFYNFLNWKSELYNFRQDDDLNIDKLNNILENNKILYIEPRYFKVFFYYIYLINRDNIKKYKILNNNTESLEDDNYNQIDINEIIEENNIILSQT